MIYGGIEKRDLLVSLLCDVADFMDTDCMYSVTDTEKFIAYKAGKTVDIKAQIGAKVPPQSPHAQAFLQKRAVTKIVPKEVWGVPFRSTSTPIVDDNGTVVGCVGIGLSIERETQLLSTYESFTALLKQANIETTNVTTNMLKLSTDNSKVSEIMSLVLENAKKTDKILNEVRKISRVTDMLAVNAEIEAARAGSVGKGFAVVANEIKRFSENIKKNMSSINVLLEEIGHSVDSLVVITDENIKVIDTQIDTMNNLNSTINSMHHVSKGYTQDVKL